MTAGTAISEASKRLDRRTRLKVEVAIDWKDDQQTDLRLFVDVENRSLHPVQLASVAIEGAYRGGGPGWVNASKKVVQPHSVERFDLGSADDSLWAVERYIFDQQAVDGVSFGAIYNGGGPHPCYLTSGAKSHRQDRFK